MTLETATKKYEVKNNVTIDYARPQSWFDAVKDANVQINPQDYVWVYEKNNGIFGKPLHKDTIMADSIIEEFNLERAMLLREISDLKK